MQGGTENLLEGWVSYINDQTQDQAELVRLDSLEHSFWDLIETYKRFFELDMSRFDLVISTKYPAWMIGHRTHICYLQHCLRGLYDTYHFLNLPEHLPEFPDEMKTLMSRLRSADFSRSGFLKAYQLLVASRDTIHTLGWDSFPGVLIREIVHYFDRCGLQGVQQFYCISDTVRQRTEYFPQGIVPAVIHHPTSHVGFMQGDFKHIFTVSRLDHAKRVDRIIRAYRQVKSELPLLIAGTGPHEQELKELAAGDSRIRFLGFVDDQQLLELYRDSLCVIFTPYDEDYGLVTIEAMQSGKPVITLSDSGGVKEFVTDGETGYIVDDERGLASRIDHLASHSEIARSMGQQALERVKNISWKYLTETLIGGIQKRKKIVVCSTFSCYPPQGGGQVRIYNIYKRLAKDFDVTILVLSGIDSVYEERVLDNGLREITIPQSQEHAEKQWELERELKCGLYDVAMIRYAKFSTRYADALDREAALSDLVIFSHPYLFPVYHGTTPCIYEAHNIEYTLKQGMIPDGKKAKVLLQELYEVEKQVCLQSAVILATSEEERQGLIDLYEIQETKFHIVPNGVDTDTIRYVSPEERKKNKKKIGVDQNVPVSVFLGSWHEPNLEAFEFIIGLAQQTPEHLYFVIGSVCDCYKQKCHDFSCLPPNIKCFGFLDDEVKNELMNCCDIGLNPMFSGAGTNLKILEYLARGMTVVSTEFGARGLDQSSFPSLHIADQEHFIETIHDVTRSIDSRPQKQVSSAIAQKYSWGSISSRMKGLVNVSNHVKMSP